MTESTNIGTEEGATCGRDGCQGKIELTPVENCSCHINPPCGACVESHPHCEVCGWDSEEE